ncbi:mitochondrial carrier, partial [Testicularia cyperi]
PSASSSFFPTPAIDHAFAGIAAGAAATVCMNPLDLIKTKFQVDTSRPQPLRFRIDAKGKARAVEVVEVTPKVARGWRYYALGGKVGHDMIGALQEIVRTDGYRGLYRGLSPNVVGNSASWGLYFLWYTMIKEHMSKSLQNGDVDPRTGEPKKLSAGQHLLAASESGAITALMTNPVWVVKTRMFTTPQSAAVQAATVPGSTSAPVVYRGLWHGLTSIYRHEGIRGLYKGAVLALVGVSNGAIQFMAYEELKKWRTSVAARRLRRNATSTSGPIDTSSIKLANTEYVVMSGVSKVAAILSTYPYQVIRSRIQNHATAHIYPDIPTCIRLTYTQEGLRAFYKGLVPNLVRILPGTCVTFVVYENVSWALRGLAKSREAK